MFFGLRGRVLFGVAGVLVLLLSVLPGVVSPAAGVGTTPEVETTISVFRDGSPTDDGGTPSDPSDDVWDATSYDPATGTDSGMDAVGDNNLVKNLDSVTYKIEVSLNEADDTAVTSTVFLDDSASWNAVPGVCADPGVAGTNLSYVDDTTGDGLFDTLVCQLSQDGEIADEGTKWVYYPSAKAKGSNTPSGGSSPYNPDPFDDSNADCATTVQGVVLSTPELLSASSCIAAQAQAQSAGSNIDLSNEVQTYITAGFGLTFDKSVGGLPDFRDVADASVDTNDNRDYKALADVVGPDGTSLGFVIKWHLDVAYASGSELVADNFTDINFTDDYEIDHDVLGYLPGRADTLLYDWAGADPCGSLDGNGAVTCLQDTAGNNSTNANPISISVTGIDTANPINNKYVSLYYNLWVPMSDINKDPFDSEFVNVENTTDIVDYTGSSSIESVTGVSQGLMSTFEDFQLGEQTGVPGYYTAKSFWGNNPASPSLALRKQGSYPVFPGQIKTSELHIITTNGTINKIITACDKLDTSSFEFVGLTEGPFNINYYTAPAARTSPETDPGYYGANDWHTEWNPSVGNAVLYNVSGGDAYTQTFLDPSLYPDNLGLSYWYSTVAHGPGSSPLGVNDLQEQRDAGCDNDVNGDGSVVFMDASGALVDEGGVATTGVVDWYEDYDLIPAVDGGKEAVTKIRMDWLHDTALVSRVPFFEVYPRTWARTSWDLKVKETATGYGADRYLPNYSMRSGHDGDPGDGLEDFGNDTTDVSSTNFSLDEAHDRVRLVDGLYGISKDVTYPEVRPGDVQEFTLDPYTQGVYGTDVALKITDVLPAGATYISDDCSYCATAPSAGDTILVWTVPGHTVGDDLPAFKYLVQVSDTASSGDYSNTVYIDSDNQVFDDDTPSDNKIDSALYTILPSAEYEISKSLDSFFSEVSTDAVASPSVLNSYTYSLMFSRYGSEDFLAGDYIDILPYNSDLDPTLYSDGHTTSFANRDGDYYNPEFDVDGDGVVSAAEVGVHEASPVGPSAFNEYHTSSAVTSVGLDPANPIVVPAWATAVEYTTDDPTTIPNNPCDSRNQPAGYSPVVGDPCHYQYVLNGGMFIDGAAVGDGSIVWGAAPADLKTVTAFRVKSVPHVVGEAARTLDVVLQPYFNLDGDIYCNNFSGYTAGVSLDLISNDVCHEVVAGSVGDYVWYDANLDGVQDADEQPLAGVTMKLLVDDGTGNFVPFQIPDGSGGLVDYVVVTDADGLYLFEDLPSGDYQVMVDTSTLPVGAAPTWDADNNIAGDGTQDNMSSFTLAGPSSDPSLTDVDDNRDQDFGYAGPDLALRKTLADGQAGVVQSGDDVTFTVEIFNQGVGDAYNVGVIDYLPAGLTLSSADSNGWTDSSGQVTNTIAGPVAQGESVTVDIVVTVDSALGSGDVVNEAEITGLTDADGNVLGDLDSTPDAEQGDALVDDDVDCGCPDDEDDHDLASLIVENPEQPETPVDPETDPLPEPEGDSLPATGTNLTLILVMAGIAALMGGYAIRRRRIIAT